MPGRRVDPFHDGHVTESVADRHEPVGVDERLRLVAVRGDPGHYIPPQVDDGRPRPRARVRTSRHRGSRRAAPPPGDSSPRLRPRRRHRRSARRSSGEGRQVHLAAGVGGGPSGALPPARPRGRPQVRGARILYPLEEHRQLIACVQLQLVIGRLRRPRSLRSWCGSNQEGWQGGALPPGLCMIARRLMACQAREQVVR